MKSNNIYFFILFFLGALVLLLPIYFGLKPALYTQDTSYYMYAFQHDTDLCSAAAVESILFRCLLYKSYLIDPSYALFSFFKILLTAGIVTYFSYVLSKVSERLKCLALLPLLHPFFGMYVMLDERDVVFAQLLALAFIQVLHLRYLKFKNNKVAGWMLLNLILMCLLRQEGYAYSFFIGLYSLSFYNVKHKIKIIVSIVSCAAFVLVCRQAAHSNSLRYSLMISALVMSNSSGSEENPDAINNIQSQLKNPVKDPELNFENPGSVNKALHISMANWELFPAHKDAWDFNKGVLKLVLNNPVLFFKIRWILFKTALYDRIFRLDNYPEKIERQSVYAYGKYFYEVNLQPNLPSGTLFNFLASFEEKVSELTEENFIVAVFTTFLFGLVVFGLCTAFFSKVHVSVLATGCLIFQAALSFFLAPLPENKYFFLIFFVGLFVFVLLVAEINAAISKQNKTAA